MGRAGWIAALALFFIGCDGGGQAPAQSAEPAQQVDEKAAKAAEVRQSVLKLVRTNFVPLVGVVRGQVAYEPATVEKHALRITQLMRMMPDAFEPDTRGTGVKTEALDRIWEDKAAFNEKLHNAIMAADALLETARAGEEAAVKEAIGALGKTCGNCHDDFREDTD